MTRVARPPTPPIPSVPPKAARYRASAPPVGQVLHAAVACETNQRPGARDASFDAPPVARGSSERSPRAPRDEPNATSEDQASALRSAVNGVQQLTRTINTVVGGPVSQTPTRGPRIIAIASGKGGVGKTFTSVNLSVALAKRGVRTLLVDADFGTANADVMLGVNPQRRIDDATDQLAFASVSVPVRERLRLIPGSVGASCHAEQRRAIVRELAALRDRTDLVVVDTGAGINDNVLSLLGLASVGLVVVTPEPTSIADAYALFKSAHARRRPEGTLGFLVNQAYDEQEARHVHKRLTAVAARFLRVRPPLIGWIPRDEAVPRSIREQRPLVAARPLAVGARAVDALSERLAARLTGGERPGGTPEPATTDRRSRGLRGWFGLQHLRRHAT